MKTLFNVVLKPVGLISLLLFLGGCGQQPMAQNQNLNSRQYRMDMYGNCVDQRGYQVNPQYCGGGNRNTNTGGYTYRNGQCVDRNNRQVNPTYCQGGNQQQQGRTCTSGTLYSYGFYGSLQSYDCSRSRCEGTMFDYNGNQVYCLPQYTNNYNTGYNNYNTGYNNNNYYGN